MRGWEQIGSGGRDSGWSAGLLGRAEMEGSGRTLFLWGGFGAETSERAAQPPAAGPEPEKVGEPLRR